MALQVTAIMLGVSDLARSKKFYGEGLGGTIDKDYPAFVSLSLGDGSSSLALYEREAAANDAGVSAEGSGFTGISFHYIVAARETVDEVIASAVAATAPAAQSMRSHVRSASVWQRRSASPSSSTTSRAQAPTSR